MLRCAGSPSLVALVGAFVTTVAGCAPSSEAPPASPRVPTPAAAIRTEEAAEDTSAQNLWESCYSTFGPTGNAETDLGKLVRDCGPAGGMHAMTPVHVATQSQQDPVDRYTFDVPTAGRCYRVYAASDASVKDLDLLLRTAAGDPVVADVTHDSWPVLPSRAPICFPDPGTVVLEVSVFKGEGRYALQVWGR